MIEQQASPAPGFASPKGPPEHNQDTAVKARRGTTTAWFTRKRVIAPTALAVLLVIILAAGGGFG